MTETSSPPPSSRQAPADAPGSLSADLLNIIVAFLTPMFLGGSAGDVELARLAAIETVCAYRICSYGQLLTVVQLIAFSLATLDSLGLSMEDDLSLSMILRLRGNANALHRSGERHRNTLETSQRDREPQLRDAAPPVPALPVPAPPVPTSAFHACDKPVGPISPPKVRPQASSSPVPPLPPPPQGSRPPDGLALSAPTGQQAGPSACHFAPPRHVSLRAAALGSSASHLLSGAEPPSPFVYDAGIRPR